MRDISDIRPDIAIFFGFDLDMQYGHFENKFLISKLKLPLYSISISGPKIHNTNQSVDFC